MQGSQPTAETMKMGDTDQKPKEGDPAAGGEGQQVPLSALKEERTKRQELQRQVEELQSQAAAAGASTEEIDEIITEDDLSNLDAKAINEKLKKALSPLKNLSSELNDVRKRQATKEERERTEAIVGQFDIFNHDDEELADEARSALETRVKRLADEGKTGEDALKQAAADVAKRFSRFAANKAAAGEEEDEEDLVPPGGGSAADAAHAKPEPPKTPAEARKRAMDIATGKRKRK